jgi:catechol 2,3-dioxygenase-like lactoylglutathione lyase family enzyme
MEKYPLGPISYITLWVEHFDECVIFYRDKLGLPLEWAEENFAQFATQGTQLYLHRLGLVHALRADTVEIHFEVQDVDAAYQALTEQGVRFTQGPANMPWGMRMASFKDPEGFSIEIVGPLKL